MNKKQIEQYSDKNCDYPYNNNHKAVGIKAERPGNLFFKENAEILFEIEGACADCKQQKHQHIDNQRFEIARNRAEIIKQIKRAAAVFQCGIRRRVQKAVDQRRDQKKCRNVAD